MLQENQVTSTVCDYNMQTVIYSDFPGPRVCVVVMWVDLYRLSSFRETEIK